jgi:DNA-binding Xre family transcriptional regulator
MPFRTGIPLDPDQLDHQLAIRAVTARQLAAKAGLAESVISRARNHRIREGTLRKIADALLAFPVIDGVDLLIATPATKKKRIDPLR